MAKILIIIPWFTQKNLIGYLGMLKNFLDEMRSHEIKIFCTSINLFQNHLQLNISLQAKNLFISLKEI